MDILLLVICAVVSGAGGWEAIEEFGQAKLRWRRQFAPVTNSVPSPDCIAGVISRRSVKGFQACFASWTEAITEATGDQVIAVDGKTAKGSRDRARGPARGQCLGGQQSPGPRSRGNGREITAIPRLLELIGCIVTLDAMGCQREIAAQIVNQGAEYMLGFKGNQNALHEAVKDFFAVAQADEFAGVDDDFYEEVDKDHGRLETRRYWITETLPTLPNTEQ